MIQGLAHRWLPIHAVQFHPESILSEHGNRIAANFLAILADPIKFKRRTALLKEVK